MNTREELLNGLRDAVSVIRQLSDIQQRLNQVRGRYQNVVEKKQMGKLAKFIIGLMLLGCIFPLVSLNVGGFVAGVIETAVVYAVIKFIYKLQNQRIDSDNQRIMANNENIKVQEQTVLNELQSIQIAYQERIGSWYPDKYCSVDAAEFFYSAVKDYRADSIKEAINLYENTLHQRRMEAGQKKAIEQQKLNNLLAAGSLFVQGTALKEQSRHNAMAEFEMKEANRTLNDIRTRL